MKERVDLWFNTKQIRELTDLVVGSVDMSMKVT
jgi:hypothetical protein